VAQERALIPAYPSLSEKCLETAMARETMSDHDQTQKAFEENRERLRVERLAREALAGPMLYPSGRPEVRREATGSTRITGYGGPPQEMSLSDETGPYCSRQWPTDFKIQS
jgi:hypothetical protein